jgi:putative nucleotidyltransferase with HDIG domain
VVASFAGQLAVAIENARLYVDLENTFLGTIGALAAAVDAKDPYTYGHSSEVTEHTIAIAHRMGLSADEIEKLRIGALLHDIGKIGIDGAILNKPGRLTDEEFEIIKGHPDIAANILSSLEFLTEVVPLVRHHHEHYAGGGYPLGIAGEDIPLGARIIAVADAFNAMTSDRPYRTSLAHDVAIRELMKHSGTQFDPEVVRAFLRVAEVAASA